MHAQGAYKTAGEGLVRDAMSDAQREQLGRLIDTMHDELTSALGEGRGVSREIAGGWLDRGLVSADEAVTLGLADAVGYDDELAGLVSAQRGDEKPPFVGAAAYLARRTSRILRPLLPRPAHRGHRDARRHRREAADAFRRIL